MRHGKAAVFWLVFITYFQDNAGNIRISINFGVISLH